MNRGRALEMLNFYLQLFAYPDAEREVAKWRGGLLAPLNARAGSWISTTLSSGAGRRPSMPKRWRCARVTAAGGVSLPLRFAGPELLDELKKLGTQGHFLGDHRWKRPAGWKRARRADAVIAQGLETGGHRGNVLTEDSNERKSVPSPSAARS